MTKQSKSYYIYAMMSASNQVIYFGVTNNLIRRVYEHRNKIIKSFTSKYNVVKLVYFEEFKDVLSAISREKQIKGGSRKRKIDLIGTNNPDFNDLYEDLL